MRPTRIVVGEFRNCLVPESIRDGETCRGITMQATHHLHIELRHATVPTYVVSYLFPILLLLYEIHRVGRWIYDYGMHFSNFRYMGYEFLLMLVFVGVQAVVGVIFLLGASIGGHHDFEHRVSNLLTGLSCSMVVIAFDLALQYAL